MKDIFVSYRRSDSSATVGRLIDRLEMEFGEERIFRDLDSIDYGQDFGEVINRALQQCKVILVVIGDGWVNAEDEEGKRRLDDDGDWVRIEVSKALNQGMCVIPVLVQSAKMVSASQLPDDLKPLATRNAARVRDDPDFDTDMERLFQVMKRCLGGSALPRRTLLVAVAVAALAALVIGVVVQYKPILNHENEPEVVDTAPPPDPGPVVAAQPVKLPNKLHFLGIGINSYPFHTIRFAAKDIENLQERFRRNNPASRLGSFVTLYNSDATRQRILSEIKLLRSRLGRDEVAVIAFSGIELVTDQFYLLPYDADVKAPKTTAISAEEIRSVMPNAKGEVVFFLDVCKSAQFGEGLQRINPSIITLASTGKSQLAYESPSYGTSGGGAFSTALCRGLDGDADGAIDGKRDGRVTVAELAKFVQTETPKIVAAQGLQQPVLIGDPVNITVSEPHQGQ